MHIKIWGSRGSIPVSGENFARHGGSTTCLEVAIPDASGDTPERVIIDCGTGFSDLGRNWGNRPHKALVLQTHMHWDHIQGFPFFCPLFTPGASFEFWSVDREGQNFRDVLANQMTRPTFPVGLDIIPANLHFASVAPCGSAQLGDLTLSWAEMIHPSGSTAWKFNYKGRSVVFSGDVEVEQGCREDLIAFSANADLLIMDAQYTPEEYPSRRGFGHSTPLDAVDVAQKAGVARLLLTHHDPSHTDDALDAKLAIARKAAGHTLRVDNARDRMNVLLPALRQRPSTMDLIPMAI